MVKKTNESPIIFAGISKSYLDAFNIVWNTEFSNKNKFYWDLSLVFHPMSHLIGIALETSIKGLLVRRNGEADVSHDLLKLYKKLDDRILEEQLINVLIDIQVPENLISANPKKTLSELENMYRNPVVQIDFLNRIYAFPFATRYPVRGGHMLPNLEALQLLANFLFTTLHHENQSWSPNLTVED